MKQCPKCKTSYTDDSLQFCLADGTPLLPESNDAKTAQMNFGGGERMRVNIPPDSAPTIFAPTPVIQNQPTSPDQPAKKKFGLIVAGLIGVVLLLIAAVVAAYVMLRPRGNQTIDTAVASPAPTAAPKSSPIVAANDETARLKEEMANLKKQLENQKNRKPNAATTPPLAPVTNGKTAYANSPGDGFLALRSEPSSDAGYRLAKIPHGAALTVFDCPRPSNIGKMAGRWCRVDYEGQSGWAFDAFISF